MNEPHTEKNPLTIIVKGLPTELPHDLYIPPDALEVFLEAFEGPLDLLLYLIKKQNLDILDIPMAKITLQYQEYINLMQGLKLELAAEYLLMSAMLAEIKSRLLLPRPVSETSEEDPRMTLIKRLKEYEQFKKAAEDLDSLPRVDRDIQLVHIGHDNIPVERPLPTVKLEELMTALLEVLSRAKLRNPHLIEQEPISVRARMASVLEKLQTSDFVPFQRLLAQVEGKMGVVVTFIAILELLKQSAVEIVQQQAYAPLHVRAILST
ncbi:MAG: scpA [Gammaproteobacteria bacterium]|jgi:segregation and condensation protein A|nr:scpA [Gammaproteobacteria bacterium]